MKLCCKNKEFRPFGLALMQLCFNFTFKNIAKMRITEKIFLQEFLS